MIAEEKFRPAPANQETDSLPSAGEGYWKLSWKIFKKNKAGTAALVILGGIIFLCVFGEYLRPFDVQEQNTAFRNLGPSAAHWFGTDQLGRDIFVRTCHGGRISIQIGISAALIVGVIGVIYGSISGYVGGKTDLIMMRIAEIFKGMPHLVIVILLTIILDVNGILPLLTAMTISGWVNTAQIIRGQVKQLKEQEFVIAARCMGIPARGIIFRHLLPNMMGMIIVAVMMDIPMFIFEEAFLSFIGLGLKNPAVSWGILISLAQPNLLHESYQIAFPAAAISITIIAFHILGNALKEAFDPKLRK